jgi:two-component system OmpR family sensor kinase
MFRHRLTWALASLSVAFLLQGTLAWWAVESASTQVVRGRVVSDVLQGHLALSATKQRLRTWTSQALLQAGANPAERDAHIAAMHRTLDELDALAMKAAALDDQPLRSKQEWQERSDTLRILRLSVQELDQALRDIQPLPRDADPAAAWNAINQVFDASQGKDLRNLVVSTINKEQAAVERERQAADQSLMWLAGGVLVATSAIALLAALLALYFARSLRRPLHNLNAGALALQRGDLAHRMDEQGADEFAAVAHTLNTMARELQDHREREAQARQDLAMQVQTRTAELEQALQTLQRIDASRRHLFADISHELRTPTTAIRGEAEIALRGSSKRPEDYQESLRRIAETAIQLGRVIDDLLTMARSDAQFLSIHPERVLALEPLQEALQQTQALASERLVQVRLQAEAPADTALWGDGPRLRQLMVLLIDNAIRYSHPGGCVNVRGHIDQAHWCLQVVDHGIGIAPHELPHVFERNYRGEQARRHRADGSGLGLPLALALAQAHGGSLSLTSLAGQGTTATLRLPLMEDTQT